MIKTLKHQLRFFSYNLQGVELNYLAAEKQAYAVVKSLKHFRPFLLKTHTKIIIPYSAVRQLLIQREVGEKRANWVTALQEYDVEIHPAKIVKGQGLFKMLTGSSHLPKDEDQSDEIQISEVCLNDSQSQYTNMKFFLKNGYAPSNLNYTAKNSLRLKKNQYQLVNDILFRRNYDYVLLRCLEKTEAEKVLQELHDGPVGGHFRGNTIAHKILHAG